MAMGQQERKAGAERVPHYTAALQLLLTDQLGHSICSGFQAESTCSHTAALNAGDSQMLRLLATAAHEGMRSTLRPFLPQPPVFGVFHLLMLVTGCQATRCSA